MSSGERILLTGATGYVGGRLLTALLERGEDVRCLARRPEAVPPRPGLEVVAGDVLDADAVRRALEGVDVAYYLVHAMGSAESFEQLDRRAAAIFAAAARDAGVRRIVYLGGLGSGPGLSSHLASRQEVGRLLASAGVETIEFRASIVIGSGSLSFELVRSLTERLPVMITPRWVRTRAQPIAIEDVIAYLVAGLDLDSRGNEVFEIGGAEIATYGELMNEYARQRGLRRLLVPVPVLTPRLSSLWLGLVTPVYARVGRKLVESLPHETVVHDPSALERFPIRPRSYREAIARALSNEERETAETRWSDAFSAAGRSSWTPGPSVGGRLVESRARDVPVPPAQAFAPIRRIGGTAGWYYANGLWRLRGLLDLIAGGVGLRRGRRDPETPVVGSALDFWRVEAYEPDRLLRLRAEMRLPGKAWLQFEVDGDEGASRIRQTAIFDPTGLAGLLYWYALLPVHGFVFRGMLAGIAREASGGARRTFAHRRELLG
ncbi:MAG TPA: SDR family oxidoreductase [Gaiellaceae bacterium]|nr:SDR family oxidoreductase [Gaiellaceae bacterium]